MMFSVKKRGGSEELMWILTVRKVAGCRYAGYGNRVASNGIRDRRPCCQATAGNRWRREGM